MFTIYCYLFQCLFTIYCYLFQCLFTIYCYLFNVCLQYIVISLMFVYNILLSLQCLFIARERFHCVSEVLRVQHQLGFEHRVVPFQPSLSTKSFNQICNCCLKSVSFRGRNFNPCPTLVSFITSAIVGKSICSSSESCSNCSGESNYSAASCFKINNISSLSCASSNRVNSTKITEAFSGSYSQSISLRTTNSTIRGSSCSISRGTIIRSRRITYKNERRYHWI